MQDWTGNKNSIYKTLGASNHSEAEREVNDYYATDPLAIDKLLQVEQLNKQIWECACGAGHLSGRLAEKGYTVVSSDIVDRGYESFTAFQDFLEATESPFESNFDIVTNPPYKFAKEFVLKAIELLPTWCKCCMFLKLTFLEGKARFEEIYKSIPPKIVYVFSERIQCAKNGDFKRLKASGGSAVAYAWFVWVKGYKGQTQLAWI